MFRVLIIDDTKAVHAFVKSLLGKANELAISSVYNGNEALETLYKNKSFDLILLDWEMPILNGPETLKKIKIIAAEIPVIMMTTKNKPEDIQTMMESGASEYLMKPFTIDILFEKIEFATGKVFKYAA